VDEGVLHREGLGGTKWRRLLGRHYAQGISDDEADEDEARYRHGDLEGNRFAELHDGAWYADAREDCEVL